MTLHPKWYPSSIKSGSTEDKQKYERMVRGSKDGLSRLKEIISAELMTLESPKNMQDYDNAGWAYVQADRLGQIRSLKNLMTILEFIDGR